MPVKLSARTDTDDLNQKLAELYERNEVPCVAATTIPHALMWSATSMPQKWRAFITKTQNYMNLMGIDLSHPKGKG